MSLEIWLVIIFLMYYFLCLSNKHLPIFIFFAFVFVFVSSLFRGEVPYTANADYWGQYIHTQQYFEYSISNIFKEPYLFLINDFFLLFFSKSEEAFQAIYILNFMISSFFFIWLARRKDISLILKCTFFTLYYFLFTYTVIRNSIAYILIAVTFYHLIRNRTFQVGKVAFLFHMSSLPVVLSTYLGIKPPSKRVLLYIVTGGLLVGLVMNIPIFSHLLEKFNAYSSSDYSLNRQFHTIYFLFVVFCIILLYVFNKKSVYMSIFIFNFILYVILFLVNPVMSFRFSIYIISFIIMYPFRIERKFLPILNVLALTLLSYFMYSFYSNHPFL